MVQWWARRPEGYTVYNFEVEAFTGKEGDGKNTHSYFVGKQSGGAWMHNTCAGDHHFFPRSLGSKTPYGHSSLTHLNSFRHTRIHKALAKHLKGVTKTINGTTVDMFLRIGNSGAVMRDNFTKTERLSAFDDFHQTYQGGVYNSKFQAEVMTSIQNGWVQ